MKTAPHGEVLPRGIRQEVRSVPRDKCRMKRIRYLSRLIASFLLLLASLSWPARAETFKFESKTTMSAYTATIGGELSCRSRRVADRSPWSSCCMPVAVWSRYKLPRSLLMHERSRRLDLRPTSSTASRPVA